MSKAFAGTRQEDRWQSPAVYFVAFTLIALLSEVVSVFLSLSFLKNGVTDGITLIYGVMSGFVIASVSLMTFAFVAKQREDRKGWKLGPLVFLTCLMASLTLSVLTMQDAFVYHLFNWPTSFLILGLNIAGLLALRFLGKKKTSELHPEGDQFDSEANLKDWS